MAHCRQERVLREPQPAALHLRNVGIEAHGLPERVPIREVDEAHAHHEHEQMPHVAGEGNVAAGPAPFEDRPQAFDDRCFREQPGVLGEQPPVVEVFPEQEFDEVGVLGEKLEVPRDHGADGLLRRAARRKRRHLGGLHPGVDRSQRFDIQAFLVAEVVVEHAFVAAGGSHDLVDRDAMKAPRRKLLHGRGEQPGPSA